MASSIDTVSLREVTNENRDEVVASRPADAAALRRDGRRRARRSRGDPGRQPVVSRALRGRRACRVRDAQLGRHARAAAHHRTVVPLEDPDRRTPSGSRLPARGRPPRRRDRSFERCDRAPDELRSGTRRARGVLLPPRLHPNRRVRRERRDDLGDEAVNVVAASSGGGPIDVARDVDHRGLAGSAGKAVFGPNGPPRAGTRVTWDSKRETRAGHVAVARDGDHKGRVGSAGAAVLRPIGPPRNHSNSPEIREVGDT